VAKYTEGIFPLCWGKGQNIELKKPMWGWDDSATPVEKARHYTTLEKPGAS
jgi:hypothetical protein